MTNSDKWIVATSINAPTEAIHAFSDLRREGWALVVVGDRKTPRTWECPGVHFLSTEEQLAQFGRFAAAIPFNHYSRKNLGYLFAMKMGAQVIIDTDDDNIPYARFGANLGKTVKGTRVGGAAWINVYMYFSSANIWPRGLWLGSTREKGMVKEGETEVESSIQQFLADDDPDVDAIYRLVIGGKVRFEQRLPVIVDRDCYVPFNSQNTVFFREAFPLMYLPCHVNFRMTDIWRSLIAQRVMWEMGSCLTFHSATVRQERNAHSLVDDFMDETVGYTRNDEIRKVLQAVDLSPSSGNVHGMARICYEALVNAGIVKQKELRLLELWERACVELS